MHVVETLKKNLEVNEEIQERAKVKVLKGSIEKSVNFRDLATSHSQLYPFFGEAEQQISLFLLVKKIVITKEKCLKMTIFNKVTAGVKTWQVDS